MHLFCDISYIFVTVHDSFATDFCSHLHYSEHLCHVQVVRVCIDYVLQHGCRDEHMSTFLQWLSDHGVDTSAVVIEQFADAGYGLKAARDIKVDAFSVVFIYKFTLNTDSF